MNFTTQKLLCQYCIDCFLRLWYINFEKKGRVIYLKLLFIFTGGTISCSVSGSIMSPEGGKMYRLIDDFIKKYDLEFEYDTLEPFTILSENSNIDTLNKLIECVRCELNKDYDGIIITHGTDTLMYTSAVLSYSVNTQIPICLVSSDYPIEDERTNGILNLFGAYEFISRDGTAGVWVSYKNENEDIKIHCGSRLLGPISFSSRVESAFDSYYCTVSKNGELHKNVKFKSMDNEIEHFTSLLKGFEDSIVRLSPSPLQKYPEINEKVKIVILDSYHSGTINTESFMPADWFDGLKNRGVKVFLTGVYSGDSYESTNRFDDLGIIPICNISPIAAYVKLCFCIVQKLPIEGSLNLSLGWDYCL